MLLLVGSGRALGTVWYIRPGIELFVGRKGVSLCVEGDNSVSRKHATVFVDPGQPRQIIVTDNASKFGVFINGTLCTPNANCTAKIGDKIVFGGQASTFEVQRCRLSICLAGTRSGMDSLVLSVHKSAETLGIPVTEDVKECTHLLLPQLEVTRKLVHGLALGCQVVTHEYLLQFESHSYAHKVTDPTPDRVKEYIQTMKYLPLPQLPGISKDSAIDLSSVEWKPNSQRQSLFSSKLFVFSDITQHEKYQPIVEAAGGSSIVFAGAQEWMMSKDRSTSQMDKQCRVSAESLRKLASNMDICNLNLIVPPLQKAGENDKGFVSRVASMIGIRPISESEISLAILFVSCQEHTNSAIRDTDMQNPESLCGYTSESKPVPARQGRRRREARINSFWDTAVAGGNNDSATNKQPGSKALPPACELDGVHTVAEIDPLKETQSAVHKSLASTKLSTRHKRNIDDFWSSSIHNNPSHPSSLSAKTASTETREPAVTVSTPANDSSMDLKSIVQDGTEQKQATCPDAHMSEEVHSKSPRDKALIETVSLVKHTSRLVLHQVDTSDIPNFKRFRKTVHPYQF
ncbi:hypothetical protein BX667DRAFT_520042 [Coemansia mojavensis]|nr:hypothetical protein BX667DRAFT_520042 [Coemansia mojavensis]